MTHCLKYKIKIDLSLNKNTWKEWKKKLSLKGRPKKLWHIVVVVVMDNN